MGSHFDFSFTYILYVYIIKFFNSMCIWRVGVNVCVCGGGGGGTNLSDSVRFCLSVNLSISLLLVC